MLKTIINEEANNGNGNRVEIKYVLTEKSISRNKKKENNNLVKLLLLMMMTTIGDYYP